MNKETELGMNRTGIDMAPKLSKEMLAGSEAAAPTPGDETAIEAMRGAYVKEADKIGSVPVPATIKGMAKSAQEKLAGNKPEVLIDKLGERLAFERSGTRLYDLLINKCEAAGKSRLPLDQLRHIRSDEARHFALVAETMESLGADSTAQTPSADITGVASKGLYQVLSDPSTTIAQSLEAILTAELADNAGWELLSKVAAGMGMDKMAASFEQALADEAEHLTMVKQWLEDIVMTEAGAK